MDIICRVCMKSELPMEYIDLSSDFLEGLTYADCFALCTGIIASAEEEDEEEVAMPQIICRDCGKSLENTYCFIEKARQADSCLKQKLRRSRTRLDNSDGITDDKGIIMDMDNNEIEIMTIESIDEHELLDCDTIEDIPTTSSGYELDDENMISKRFSYIDDYKEDENDDMYLLTYEEEKFTAGGSQSNGCKWKCCTCKEILAGSVSYEGHMNMHKNLRPYKCTFCTCEFRCKEALENHTTLRHTNKKTQPFPEHLFVKEDEYVCSECFKIFNMETSLVIHKFIAHIDESVAIDCPLCSLNYVFYMEEFIKHLSTNHLAEYRKQGLGNIPNDSSDQVQVSSDNENTEKKQHKRSQKKSSGVERHLPKSKEKTDDTQKFICQHCEREFKNQKTLNQHKKKHEGIDEDIVHVCVECDRQYGNAFLLDQHQKHAHKDREYACTICGNAFKLKNQLKNHMKLHLERNIQCTMCDKKYSRKFDLDVHMRTAHTGEKPFQCDLCDKSFAIKVRLTYHIQKHMGIKHTCKECGAEFNSRQKLKAHSFKHNGMPYRCDHCDHGYPNRDVFKRHLLRVHNTTMSDEALVKMFERNTGKTIRIKEVKPSTRSH